MTDVMDVPPLAPGRRLACDVAVVGGGTAGTMAAITVAERGASVLLIERRTSATPARWPWAWTG
jgi:succinate dehydrogenase/fumarate reductase flavoprotein subunit